MTKLIQTIDVEQKDNQKIKPTNKTVVLSREKFDAVLFDMDGVVTRTASVHAAVWKKAFDEFLKKHFPNGTKPFDIETDYHQYVDGKPRYDGVASFLKSRNVELPEGNRDDAPGLDTMCALGNLKNKMFLEQIRDHHVQPYETTVALIQSLKNVGIKVAIITASENGMDVLKAANLTHVFDAKVDGLDDIHLGLKGKPAPDSFLEAARQLGAKPARAVVVEDAVAGVEAGHNGKFGLTIGVDRNDNIDRLKKGGADVVVKDLAEVGVEGEVNKLPGMAQAELGVSDKNWVISYKDFDAKLQGRREALCAIGNGYFVTRAAAAEAQANAIHFPGTYFAGVYNRLVTNIAGRSVEHEDLVNVPNWLCLSFKIEDGNWFELEKTQIISYQQDLNLRQGILYRKILFKDELGRETSIAEKRFVHMRHSHIAGLESIITAHNWSGRLTIRSALDGRVLNATGIYTSLEKDKKHLEAVESSVNDDVLFLKMQTKQSHIIIAEAARTVILLNDKLEKIERSNIIENNYVAQDLHIDARENDQITVRKICSLFTSRDNAISEAGIAAQEEINNAPDFATLIAEQIKAWGHLWCRFDLAIETNEDTPKVQPSLLLHLNTFQGLCTVSYHSIDLDVGLPARGWSEGYEGHIFWDDVYVFPFFNMRAPAITRAILKYRYRRLKEAKKLATALSLCGARYPWQSGSSGREETPQGGWDPDKKIWHPDYSHMQIHVGAAVAFNVWQYYQSTGDLEFLYMYGADMLIEIARFFSHFAKYNDKRDRYEIHGVVGPDEFHVRYPGASEVGINNNAYTNLMAVWTICRAQEMLGLLSEVQAREVCERLDLKADELKLWDDVSSKMFVPLQENGIISEFEGYEKLQEFPRKEDGFIDMAQLPQILQESAGLPNQYQVSKQPDVLMLFYLFSSEELKELFDRLHYDFRPEFIPANIDFYVRQTASDSSLSRVALAWVLSRANRPGAWKHLQAMSTSTNSGDWSETKDFPHSYNIWEEALGTDFFDIQGGTTATGVHIGAMIGTVDIVQRCYAGIIFKDDVLWFNPCLPDELTRLSFHLHYRQHLVQFEITREKATVTAGNSRARSIRVGVKDKIYELTANSSMTFDI